MSRAKTIAIRSLSVAGALILIPSAGYAVNVSSGDGYGNQHRTQSYSNGAYATGSLTSTHGSSVYYSGRVDLSWCSDVTVGRYSSNTSSTSGVTRGGYIVTSAGLCQGVQGVRSRVCKVRNNLPDPCGS